MSTRVKKAFQPLIDLLEANPTSRVRDIMDQVVEIASAKSAGGSETTIARNDAGEVVAVRCSYYKQWMPLSHVEFGAKRGSASGLNPMCKEAVSNWTKQQRDAKNALERLLERVQTGELAPADIAAAKEEIEANRTCIIARADGIGFATAEEAINAKKSTLDKMVAAVAKVDETPTATETPDL